VMQVVKEQITRTLSSKPTSLELFKNKVNALNYSEILKLRQTERLHQEETLAPPVLSEVLDLAFSITYDVEEYSLNFIAPSRTDFCLWTDGLSVLLGRDMSSESMRSELEILLSMEIKLRLLDLENVPIPDSAPAIPKPPSNYNFCYEFNQTEQ
ncbi:hypothetical protein XENOCAPTIV_008402, partial [Xenoophorus captivus]